MINIQKLCNNKNISINELAIKLNASVSIIHAWNLGISMPDLDQLKIILDFFKISADELLLGKKVATIDITMLSDIHKSLVRNLYNCYIEINNRKEISNAD